MQAENRWVVDINVLICGLVGEWVGRYGRYTVLHW